MPKIEKLSAYVEPQAAVVPASVSAGAISVVAVDASGGYDRAQFILSLGAFGTSAGVDCEITESATSGGAYTLIASSGITAVTAAAANKLIIVDVPVNNAKPYLKLRGTVTTAAVALGAICNTYNGTRSLGSTMEDVQEEVVV